MTTETIPEQTGVLGQALPRLDAAEKVTGRSTYAGDMHLPGMLFCKVLTSKRQHALIQRLDAAKAKALPGVKAVVTARDCPDLRYGSLGIKDRTVFARDRVRFIGEPLAAVAAIDEMTALEALDLIEVEYQDLPSVNDPFAAMKDGAPIVHEALASYEGAAFTGGPNVGMVVDADRGDVDAAMQSADRVFEEVYRSQPINQGFLEPMACMVDVDASNRINVWTSTQGPYQVRAGLAEVLDVPVSRIRIIPTELGGAFGAKLRLGIEAYAALLALQTRKPVKFVATREEAFTLSGPRLEAIMRLRTGVQRDGTIVAREALVLWDMGAAIGPGVQSGISHALGAYRIPNFRLRSYAVYTHKIPANSYRASGVADMTFAVESHTDRIARALGMDPFEFRRKNALVEGDTTVRGERLPRNGLFECLAAAENALAGYVKGPDEGVGIALCEWRGGSGHSTAQVTVNEDGSIAMLTGYVDMSGTDTALAQIVAAVFGVGIDQVVVAKRDTDLAPYTAATGGSRVIYSQGRVVQQAAEQARERLVALAAERLQTDPSSLTCAGGRVYVQGDPERGLTLPQVVAMGLNSRSGPVIGSAALTAMPYAPIYSVHAAVVKVDRTTGQVSLKRYLQAQDVGTVINPMAITGQLEGGAVQGIGRALTEHYLVEDGVPRNPSFTTYLLPLATDVPPIESILVTVPSEEGPFGARAVAEPPGFGAPAAIANAVEDAVGVRIKELPLSSDKVLMALRGELVETPCDFTFLENASSTDGGEVRWQSGG